MLPGGYVYIMASKTRRLYAGVTSNLRHRVNQHKACLHPEAFTARYNINKLVYFEAFESILQAITRESAIKELHRIQKIQLIVATNPTWKDLAQDWPMPGTPFDESKIKPPTTF